MGVITFNNISSSSLGVEVETFPDYVAPQKEYEIVHIPGRNGDLLIDDGSYSDVPRTYKISVATGDLTSFVEKMNKVSEWLHSCVDYARLEDSYEPDFFRLAYYNEELNLENIYNQAGKGELRFICRPERFYKSGETAVQVTTGSTLTNMTQYISKPLIHIEGVGSVTFTIAGVTINATLVDYINIDCETMNAYRLKAENMNSKISGDFPVIKPGNNVVAMSGSITKATVVPRYYTI